MSAAARRWHLVRLQLDRLTRALHGVEHGDVRALHRARVATRRLRELVPILQLQADTARRVSRRLRRMTRRLGTVRELDVLLQVVDELQVSGRANAEALARVGMAVARERDVAREALFDRLPIAAVRRTIAKLRAAADQAADGRAGDSRAVRWALDARLARRAARLDEGLREAGAVYLPERLHAARIAVKKLRYVMELAAEVTGADRAADVRMLKRAQDALGRMHDLQVLVDRVRQVQATLTPPSVTLWRALDNLVSLLDEDCRRLHARYMRLRPQLEEIVRRVPASGLRVPGSRAAGSRRRVR